jgi:SAM-dependent methyltransferase
MTPAQRDVASRLYVGEAGEEYFQHRKGSRQSDAQRHSSRLFAARIDPDSIVLDFGCGTGELLHCIPGCRARIGIEINGASMMEAKENGIECHSDLSALSDESVDVAITHHALEHQLSPSSVICELHRVLRRSGKLIIVVPCENPRKRRFRAWRRRIDVHLYSWTPLSLGNLVTVCGFVVTEAFTETAGYSRFNRWLLAAPILFLAGEKLVARLLGRFNVVCVARKS